ncbi:peptide deformylase [Alicyclobacillus hesperidum URH17-3-68]|uniref:Peptide deformylase n=1 Tax=Alicyclobacillus hesperidum TaxID=89784 RepID=A0A1H2UWF7_9BACL|nr:peptide deformylase [Alicyclobacillus hesperidum]KRW92392.1 peptide deformylase [Alicyclobacillus tengchongensis]EJY55837.1 peptide deformylase [Alicyclobacillus hesperidum URH17-3-68]SDW60440.1 peptide deformylase [Alicyclobacillus hesperidum]GLG01072.1 peptide deformylase [Alicyclobacillus hesperidum subsp. aegles]GLV14609.1 peptide deformylase [Alicyclobacillus hesperidum]
MAIRIIRKGEDQALRQKAKPVTQFGPAIHKLLDDMAETMYHADGIGLAANQIGILKRLVVIDVAPNEDSFAKRAWIELVNPEIIAREGEQHEREACLSLPGLSGIVERAAYVKVRAQDRNGEFFEIEGRDLLARCLQHEIDHLDGILFIDYLRPDQIERATVGERS